MAGGEREAEDAVPARPGYRISRIEAHAPVENMTGADLRRSRDGECLQVEAVDYQRRHQYTGNRSGGHGSSKDGSKGKGRRGKGRRGGEGKPASRWTGSGEDFERTGDPDRLVAAPIVAQDVSLDDAASSPLRNTNRNNPQTNNERPQQLRRPQQPRGGIPRGTMPSHDRPNFRGHSGNVSVIGSSSPTPPPNGLVKGENERRLRKSGGRSFEQERGPGRQVARALRDAIGPLRQHQGEQPRPSGMGGLRGQGPSGGWEEGATGGTCSRLRVGDERPPARGDRDHQDAPAAAEPEDLAFRQSCSLRASSEPSPRASGHAVPPSHNPSSSSITPQHAKGTCTSMCPIEEMRAREAGGELSPFEATDATAKLPFRQRVADPGRTVKKYRRSAAGRDMHSPEQLRPLEVLKTTLRYLVRDVFAKACVQDGNVAYNATGRTPLQVTPGLGSGGVVGGSSRRGSTSTLKAYLFVEDRLRAVRQDLTVQGLALTPGAAEVLKIAANFYVVSGYLLCDETAEVFDRHLHSRELQGVFSSLVELFFQARGFSRPHEVFRRDRSDRRRDVDLHGEDEYLCLQAVHALVIGVRNTGGHKEDAQLDAAAGGQGVGRVFNAIVSKLCSPPLMVDVVSPGAVVGATSPIEDGGPSTDAPFKQAFPKMATAIRLLGAVGAGNWSEFHRILGRYPPDKHTSISKEQQGGSMVADEGSESPFALRLRCLCQGMLLPMRAHALRALNRCFGKREMVPLADITRTLRMRDDAHAAGLCRALSLPVQDETVTFKSVPAVWKTDSARMTGFLPPQTSSGIANDWCAASSAREDDWVGLSTGEAGCTTAVGSNGSATTMARAFCQGCGGSGCSWCDEGGLSEGVGEGSWEEGSRLWEAALAPL